MSFGIANIAFSVFALAFAEMVLVLRMNRPYYEWLCFEGLPNDVFDAAPAEGRAERWAWVQHFDGETLLARAKTTGFHKHQGFRVLVAVYTPIEGVYWRSIRVGRPGRLALLGSIFLAPLLQIVQDWHALGDIFLCAAIPGLLYVLFHKSGESRVGDYLAEAERDGRDVFASGDARHEQ